MYVLFWTITDGFLYAIGGQDGVQCLNHVERYCPKENKVSHSHKKFKNTYSDVNFIDL